MSNKFVFEAGIQTPAQKRTHMQALAHDPCYLVNSDNIKIVGNLDGGFGRPPRPASVTI